MAPTEPERTHSTDPSGVLDKPYPVKCWFCRAVEPTGHEWLRGTRIPVCATGEGCRDGRIFHGPQGKPHQPDEPCPLCGPGRTTNNPARPAVGRNTRRNTRKRMR